MVEKSETEGQARRDVLRLRLERAQTNYANLAVVTSTSEEVIINFGINVMPPTPERELNVEISNRTILTYASAKRLAITLGNIIKRYESAHGEIEIGPPPVVQGEAEKGEN